MTRCRLAVWYLVGARLLPPAPNATAGGRGRPNAARRNAPAEPDLQPRTDSRTEIRGFVPSTVECTVRATLNGLAQGLGLDCDDLLANNESHLAADPVHPLHAVVSSNDYGSCCDEFYTTLDGGPTRKTGDMAGGAP